MVDVLVLRVIRRRGVCTAASLLNCKTFEWAGRFGKEAARLTKISGPTETDSGRSRRRRDDLDEGERERRRVLNLPFFE